MAARALDVGWSARPGRADVAGPVHARGLDDPAERRRLADELRPQIEPGETVPLPAVLGLARAGEAWDDLQDLLGAPVAEVPTVPPCVPGMRLQRALTRARCARPAAAWSLGPPAVGVEGTRGPLAGVRVRDAAARTRALPADAVVLATGGFAAGGLELDSCGALTETVAGLPVTGPAARRAAPEPPPPRPPAADAGRPHGGRGACARWTATARPVWANLHAAGALVAGAEPWREKSGEGICLAGG